MGSLLRRHPGFRRLWAAGAISLVGDWLSLVAVATLAASSGHGPLALALVFAAHMLPGAVLAPVAGAIVDSFDRRRVLIAADALAAVATVLMMIAALAGAPFVLAALLLGRSAISALVPPGESAALRHLVDEGELVAANTLLAATWSVAFVVGMALGGAAAMLGPALALALDAASFAVAALVHATLPPLPVTSAPRSLAAVVRATPRDTAAALRVAAASPALLAAVLGKVAVALAGGAAWVALNLVAADAHPFGPVALSFGLLQAIRGAGTGIGPALAARLMSRGRSERVLQAIAIAVSLAAIPCLSLAHSALGLSIVALVWGAGTGANWVLAHSSLQRHSAIDVIGRLAAFDELLVAVSMVTSAFVGAAVAETYSHAAAPIAGVALGIAGVIAVGIIVATVPRTRASVPDGVG